MTPIDRFLEKLQEQRETSSGSRNAEVVASFSVLIHAWQSGDQSTLEDARDRLENLGVHVQVPLRLPTGKG